uniref:Uncharacterized protein n=1 Tax=Schistosoma haematobium TaxID=6185 RepID=A0A094ZYK5_SCHHA
MNVYYSQKTKFLKSIYKPLDTDVEPDAFSFMPYISSSVEDKLIKVSAGLLNPPYLEEGYSMSEKYGTIGWFIGRQLMYEVNNNKNADAPETSQVACNSPDATVFEAQLCCLQKQDEFKENNEKVSGPLKSCFCQGKVSCSTAIEISTLELIFELSKPFFLQNIDNSMRISLKNALCSSAIHGLKIAYHSFGQHAVAGYKHHLLFLIN